MAKRKIGSSLDDLLKDESMLDDAEKMAAHRVADFLQRGLKPISPIMKAVHESASGMHRLGFMSDDEMKKYDEMCLEKIPNKVGSSADDQRLDASSAEEDQDQ